jgi:hypothetical protein
MKHRYWLFRRNGIYYLQAAQTGHKENLHISDRCEAQRLREARDDATKTLTLELHWPRPIFLTVIPQITKRTCQNVFDEFCTRGKPQTQERRRRVAASKPLVFFRFRKLLETSPRSFCR